jgi:hypothetical protein
MAATIVETDGVTLLSQPAATYGPFKLLGGQYAVTVGTGTGTAQLQRVLSDGNLPNVNGTAFAASTYNVLTLAPGLYQVTIGTAAADVSISRIKLG